MMMEINMERRESGLRIFVFLTNSNISVSQVNETNGREREYIMNTNSDDINNKGERWFVGDGWEDTGQL